MRARPRRSLLAICVSPGCQLPAAPRGRRRPSRCACRAPGTPGDAVVIIDDQALGTLELVTAHGVALPPGVHHVTVKADGYFPWDPEVEAKRGRPPIELEVALMPVPD